MARQAETSNAAKPVTEDQIIGVLREHEAGVKTAELCRKHGISKELANERRRIGYRWLALLLRREGTGMNLKKAYRRIARSGW